MPLSTCYSDSCIAAQECFRGDLLFFLTCQLTMESNLQAGSRRFSHPCYPVSFAYSHSFAARSKFFEMTLWSWIEEIYYRIGTYQQHLPSWKKRPHGIFWTDGPWMDCFALFKIWPVFIRWFWLVFKTVITSYSIHYTKLYEYRLNPMFCRRSCRS